MRSVVTKRTHSLQNKPKILDTLAILLERHRSTVVNVDDHIVESQPDNIIGDLSLNVPCLTQPIDLLRSALCNLRDSLSTAGLGSVERLQAFLLDSAL
jgi:hypothetical protein